MCLEGKSNCNRCFLLHFIEYIFGPIPCLNKGSIFMTLVISLVQIVVNEDGIHSLLIMSATRHDTGVYQCIARNKAGEDTFSVTLTVLGE